MEKFVNALLHLTQESRDYLGQFNQGQTLKLEFDVWETKPELIS